MKQLKIWQKEILKNQKINNEYCVTYKDSVIYETTKGHNINVDNSDDVVKWWLLISPQKKKDLFFFFASTNPLIATQDNFKQMMDFVLKYFGWDYQFNYFKAHDFKIKWLF